MLFSISDLVKPLRGTVDYLWAEWCGPIILGGALLALGMVVWHFSTPVAVDAGSSATIQQIAITVVVLFAVFGLGLVVTFFWLFRGVNADAAQLDKIITYCYAFIVFSLSASVLPFVALPLLPALSEIMARSPIGIVPGCSLALEGEEQKGAPRELRCGERSDQWVVNIGGMAVPLKAAKPAAAPATDAVDSEVAPKSAPPEGSQSTAVLPVQAGKPTAKAEPVALWQVSGGLVVPLYAVVLSLMGAAVSMTRRVPEFQRRLSADDPERMTFDAAREGLVFQIMQVASAPLIVLTAYYLVDPNSRASTIALSFASGFSSETVLLMIRALVEKLKPSQGTAPVNKPSGANAAMPAPLAQPGTPRVVVPPSLNFGKGPVASPLQKTLTVSNAGTAPLVISNVACTGEFTAVASMPMTIAPGANGAIEVKFMPSSAEPKQGMLTITDSAPDSPRAVVLIGTGS